MDGYLVEQHSYHLGRESQVQEDEVPNDNSWVMLKQQGEIEPLPNEDFIVVGRGRIALEFIAREARPGRDPLPPKCPDGKLYLTNQRVVYLPTKPTETLKSFSTPILRVEGSNVASPVFGAWYWLATVAPVPNGGIPPEYALVDVKISFHDGGGSNFYEKFVAMKARLHHAQEVGASFATHAHLEPLPQYEPPSGTSLSGASAPVTVRSLARTAEMNPPPPDEAPPDYEEAQAQAVAEQLDGRLREATGRGRRP